MHRAQRRFFAGLCLLLLWQSGCAAFRPVHGVPARYLPNEMKQGDRSNRRTIDLSLLRQSPPLDPVSGSIIHRIDAGDVLGVYVEGQVGRSSEPSPVFFPQNGENPPSFGHPYPVREDGTISLPSIGSVNVRGLTLTQAEARVKQAYLTPRELIHPIDNRVQVNLQRPRQYRVLVIRQDSRNEPQSNAFLGQLNIGMVKRGTGKVVNLPAYSNDVLNALTATDGLPGLDAENAVYVIRRRGMATGGALDPRWPTDLNPALMLNSAVSNETPVVRGQSPNDAGYLHSQNVRQAYYQGMPNSGVQLATGYSGPDGTNYSMQYIGTDPNAPLEPPPVWPERSPLEMTSGQPPYSRAPTVPLGPQLQMAPGGAMPYPGAGYSGPGVSGGPYPAGPNVGAGPFYPPAGMGGPANFGTVNAPPYGPTPVNPQSAYPGGMPSGPGQPGPGYSAAPPNGYSAAPGVPPSPNAGGMSGPGSGLQPGNPAAPSPGYGPAGPMEPGLGLDIGHMLPGAGALDGRHVIRIPIRLGPGETADVRPEDVVLYDGDIVFIESRDTEVFYTGGLLGGGQYTLPRDYDLDIMQAISLAQSRGVMGASRAVGGVSALNNDVSISPSTAIVLRKLPDGGEIPVKVDLYRARTDLSERVVIQPGDFILLQYTPLEAIAAFFERHLLETALFSLASRSFNGSSN